MIPSALERGALSYNKSRAQLKKLKLQHLITYQRREKRHAVKKAQSQILKKKIGLLCSLRVEYRSFISLPKAPPKKPS